jgi:TRAP-type C4-dicarboxylate transport system permease small subunit
MEAAGASPPGRLLRRIITGWALAGGALLVAVVAMNVASVLGSAFLGRPFPGDFEMTEVGIAIAAFAFLPYCQMTGANITADIFTARARRLTLSIFALAAATAALAFSLILLWRMYYGLLDQKGYNYTTTILQFPHWTAYAVILISLALLAAAALLSLIEASREFTRSRAA